MNKGFLELHLLCCLLMQSFGNVHFGKNNALPKIGKMNNLSLNIWEMNNLFLENKDWHLPFLLQYTPSSHRNPCKYENITDDQMQFSLKCAWKYPLLRILR